MALDVLQLPPEVRELVYNYCSASDLINIACCSKSSCNSVKYMLWNVVKLPWKTIEKNCTSSLETFIFTSSLSFYKCCSIGIGDQNNASYGTPKWTHTADNYKKILKHCNANRLNKLNIEGVLTNEGMKMTVDILYNLKELSLIDTYFISSVGFGVISILMNLKKLYLQSSGILDTDMEKIVTLPKLAELHLDRCTCIRDDAIKYISNITQLKKLTISNNSYILGNAFKHLGKLENLIFLNLEDSNLGDDMLMYNCRHLKNLKSLKIGGCDNITDLGLSKISLLTLLEELDIHMCKHITNHGFTTFNDLVSLRILSFSLGNTLTVDVFLPLSKIITLKEINIINPNRRFSNVEIESFCRTTGMKRKAVNRSAIFSFLTLVKID